MAARQISSQINKTAEVVAAIRKQKSPEHGLLLLIPKTIGIVYSIFEVGVAGSRVALAWLPLRPTASSATPILKML